MNELLNKYKLVIMGAVLGIVIACLFIFIGFFNSIVIILFTLIGGTIGYFLSNNIK